MRYNPHPPYEILQNRLIDFATMQRMRRFAKYWDLVGNSGNFVEATALLWSGTSPAPSPFASFLRWSEWLYARIGRTDSIALARLSELLFKFLTEELHLDARLVAETLWRDWQRGGRADPPEFLRAWLAGAETQPGSRRKTSLLKRQSRHGAVS
jgi:hypothetical protein